MKCCRRTAKTELLAHCTIEPCAGGSSSYDAPLKVCRRHSDFSWSCHSLQSNPPIPDEALDNENEMILMLRPKMHFWKNQTDKFRSERQLQSCAFVNHAVSRPGCTTHSTMISFLLLNHTR